MNTTKTDIVTIGDVLALAEIVSAASESAKVAWVNGQGDVMYGTARHIVRGADDYAFLGTNQDVRDGFLRITSQQGFDHALSVRYLMNAMAKGEFARYDWS